MAAICPKRPEQRGQRVKNTVPITAIAKIGKPIRMGMGGAGPLQAGRQSVALCFETKKNIPPAQINQPTIAVICMILMRRFKKARIVGVMA